MTLSADVQAFVTDHRPHGTLTGDAGEPTPNGYQLEVACPCGVTFERWVFPDDAAADLPFLARLELSRMRTDADARRASLYAALGSCQLAPAPDMPELTAFKAWMSTWRGIGDIVVGMERQGFAMSLRKLVDDRWNAAFEEHRLLAPAGSANAPTPFEAVQRAAWQALNHHPWDHRAWPRASSKMSCSPTTLTATRYSLSVSRSMPFPSFVVPMQPELAKPFHRDGWAPQVQECYADRPSPTSERDRSKVHPGCHTLEPRQSGLDQCAQALQQAAPMLGVKLQLLAVRGDGDLEAAFAAATTEKADGLLVFRDATFVHGRGRQQIVGFAATHRVPAIYGQQVFIEVG